MAIRIYNYNTWSVPWEYSSQSCLHLNILSKSTLHCGCVSGVQCGVSVTHSSTRVCGLEGASVVLPCTYEYSWGDTYIRGEWNKDKNRRVGKLSDSDDRDCSLTIYKLSDNHSGVYHFQFYTEQHKLGSITGRSGVTVSVTRNDEHMMQLTICFIFSDHNGNYIQGWIHNDCSPLFSDLQVKEGAVVGKQTQTELTCSTSCSLGSNTQYVWYKNGHPLQDKTTASIPLDSSRPFEVNSYSCAVRGYEAHRSPAVCE